MNPLFVGIDVSSKNNVVCLMKPDGTKFSTFSVQNNLGGARILSERIVSALDKLQLNEVTIGMEATSIYGDSLVYALREEGSLGRSAKPTIVQKVSIVRYARSFPTAINSFRRSKRMLMTGFPTHSLMIATRADMTVSSQYLIRLRTLRFQNPRS